MHFRFIATFVALIGASAVLAAPVAQVDTLTPLLGDVTSLTDAGSSVSAAAAAALTSVEGLAAAPEVDSRALPPVALAQIFQSASDKMTPLIQNLKTAVADKSNIDTAAITSNLQSMVVVLTALLAQVQSFAQNPAALIPALLSVTGILSVLGSLLNLLFPVLTLVVTVVGSTPLGPVIAPLIANIGSLVGQTLLLVITIVPAILSGLLLILSGLLSDLGVLGLTNLLAL